MKLKAKYKWNGEEVKVKAANGCGFI